MDLFINFTVLVFNIGLLVGASDVFALWPMKLQIMTLRSKIGMILL